MNKMMAISWDDIYKNPIIGYDEAFWRYCVNLEKNEIAGYKRSENRKSHTVNMVCENGYSFSITPAKFYESKRHCPYCKFEDDIGAVNVDDSIEVFWADKRYNLNDISEYSKEEYCFKCPFCKSDFRRSMIDMVNATPKCIICNDGNSNMGGEDNVDTNIYAFRRRVK